MFTPKTECIEKRKPNINFVLSVTHKCFDFSCLLNSSLNCTFIVKNNLMFQNHSFITINGGKRGETYSA